MVGCKEQRVQNRRKQVLTGLCERLGTYHPDLCLVIELWFTGAVSVAQEEHERTREKTLNRENQT